MTREIYLDNSATTRARPEVVAAVRTALEDAYGNPSSAHPLGLRAERLVKEAREAVARALGAAPGEIVFTSGGTEANNLALLGAARAAARRGRRVITSRVEHPSVLRACDRLEEEGFEVVRLGVDRRGLVDPADLARVLTPDTVLVSLMHVNNEVGSVQPLEELARVLGRGAGGAPPAGGPPAFPLWHVDAVQSFGKLPLDASRLGVDLVSVSAHKIHGPKGCGALCVRRGVRLRPLLVGGGQEDGRRAGTENVPGIAGFGVAARLAAAEREAAAARLGRLRDRLVAGVLAAVPEARANGPLSGGAGAVGPGDGAGAAAGVAAPHIASIAFPGLRGEVLLHALAERGVFAATGAACSARRHEPSHVLRALGLDAAAIEGTLRFSLSPFTTEAEVDAAVRAVGEAVHALRGFVRR